MPSAWACQSGWDGLKHGVHVEPATVNEVGKLNDAVLWYETLPPPASVSVNRARLTVFSCVANTSTAPAGFRHAATPYAVLDLTGLAAPNRRGTPVAVTSVTGGLERTVDHEDVGACRSCGR